MSPAPQPRQTPARRRLLGAAARLFYQHGMTATGIDTIIAEAGVAKKTLYHHFDSKDELIRAYLEERHQEWMALYQARLVTASSAQESVLAIFDAYVDHAEAAYGSGFRGCGLLNAAAELSAGSLGREMVRHHKDQVEDLLGQHMRQFTDPTRAQEYAEHLSFVLEGAMVRAGLEGEPDRLHRARRLAQTLLTRAQ